MAKKNYQPPYLGISRTQYCEISQRLLKNRISSLKTAQNSCEPEGEFMFALGSQILRFATKKLSGDVLQAKAQRSGSALQRANDFVTMLFFIIIHSQRTISLAAFEHKVKDFRQLVSRGCNGSWSIMESGHATTIRTKCAFALHQTLCGNPKSIGSAILGMWRMTTFHSAACDFVI